MEISENKEVPNVKKLSLEYWEKMKTEQITKLEKAFEEAKQRTIDQFTNNVKQNEKIIEKALTTSHIQTIWAMKTQNSPVSTANASNLWEKR